MYNPYKILGVNKDASNSEILKTYEYKVETLCKNNNSLKNFFTKACNDLLDSEKRKKIDEQLFKNVKTEDIIEVDNQEKNIISLKSTNSSGKLSTIAINLNEEIKEEKEVSGKPIFYLNIGDSPSINSQKNFITHITKEINKLTSTFTLSKTSLFEKTVPLKSIFAIIGMDNTFSFVEEKHYKNTMNESFYYLNYIFTNTPYTKEYPSMKRPWKENKIFSIYGIKSIVMLGNKFIPSTKITNVGSISYKYLKNLEVTINNELAEHPEIVSKMFEDTQFEDSQKTK